MGKFFEKWLGVITVLGTALFAAIRTVSGDMDTDTMLACIWAVLAGLTVTEFLKRQLTLDKIQAQLDEICPSIRKLENRNEMYCEAARMIRDATDRIHDTSWGLDPENPDEVDTVSQADYREARRTALRKERVTYRELYTIPNAKRVQYLVGALNLGDGFRRHFIKVLRTGGQPPQVEFLVVDGREVLFSLPHVLHRPGHTPYVKLTSKTLGALLEELFEDCWDEGRPVRLEGTKAVYSDTGGGDVIFEPPTPG